MANIKWICHLRFALKQSELGESKRAALQRLFQMEKRFANVAETYKKFMADYEDLGHMRLVSRREEGYGLYCIPHHAVSIDNKFRVVFDTFVKTDTGISLNDIQLTGEKLQANSLLSSQNSGDSSMH